MHCLFVTSRVAGAGDYAIDKSTGALKKGWSSTLLVGSPLWATTIPQVACDAGTGALHKVKGAPFTAGLGAACIAGPGLVRALGATR